MSERSVSSAPPLQAAVGRALKTHRESLGLSEGALAQRLGIQALYLTGLEAGEHNLTLQRVERLAARIGADPIALIAWRD